MHQHKEAWKHNAYLIKPDQIMSTFEASKFSMISQTKTSSVILISFLFIMHQNAYWCRAKTTSPNGRSDSDI